MIELSHYTLATKAFEGSETVLYRGHRDADGAPVAVKVTRNDYPTARESARLRREFGVLQLIGHLPGVPTPYAIEKYGRGVALVMEDLGARSLHDLLEASPPDLATTLKIAVSLAGCLDAIHRLGVIHKDIKPDNVMIDEATMTPRIVDFGIAARLSQETQSATGAGALEGTLAYLSPEQTGRMNRVVDLRTDLYSLGATLYEMLTGSAPFASDDPTELIHSHIARAPTPPHERAPGVPQVLSEIVIRLLAKMPEDRYQTARGLKADLEECLKQWAATGAVAPFALGRHDLPDVLRIPQKLYGREDEIATLLAAFERARLGSAELVLVSGYPGVGKSALVHEIHKPIARDGGYFVRGKFDQINRDVPLAAVIQAFRELIRQILTEPESALEAWKSRILEAVGSNGRLLEELIPELSIVIGPQPEAPAVGPSEARNRFDLLVQRFLRVFAAEEHPLAIFYDDLQWADPASLRLFDLLLGEADSGHLLIIGAYRDSEVDAAHPLSIALDGLRRQGVTPTEIRLAALDAPRVTELVADTLGAPPDAALPLAELIFDKTQGNPFFLGQFLSTLHAEGLLRRDPVSDAWTWELSQIRAAVVTDNVVDLMLGKLNRLAPATRRVLTLAACIGHEFDLGTLATFDQRAPAAVAADLWEALREGLVVPLDGEYRFVDESAGAAPGGSSTAGEAGFQIAYRFLHDRVLQAAYLLIEPERKAEVHYELGRLLWTQSGQVPRDEDLIEVVRHLNLGAPRIVGGERIEVARLDLRAGRRAKAATAYQAATGYFSAGIELLGEPGWELDYPLCFALHAECAEGAYLSGAFDRAEALFDALLPRARTDLERARILNLRVVLYITLGKFADAMEVGGQGLALLGAPLPEGDAAAQASFGVELAEVAANLAGRRIEELIDMPMMHDEERRVQLQLLCDLSIPIYFVNATVYGTSVLMQVNISVKHGHTDVSAFAYMTYGFMLAAMMGKPVEGYAFGRLALALNDKIQNAALTAKLNLVFCGYLYLCLSLRDTMPYYMKAREAAQETGDFVYLASSWYAVVPVKLGAGFPLEELRDEATRGIAVTQRIKDAMACAVLTVAKQTIANLQGATVSRASLSDEGFDEERFRASLDEQSQAPALFYYYIFKLQIAYLHGDHESALAAAAEAEPRSMSVFGMYYTTQLHFYVCLTLAALAGNDGPSAPSEEAPGREERFARHRAAIAGLAASCPQNFQHKLLLVDAEAARVAGRVEEALGLYEQAIAAAKAQEFSGDEALANELCAKTYAGMGRRKAARGYMSDAYLGYLHWGATARADDIARDFADLLPAFTGSKRRGAGTSRTSRSTNGTTILSMSTLGGLRDAALVVRAAQAIAGELDLRSIIQRLLRLVLENAGAQRGAILLDRGGELFIEATFGVDPEVIEVGPSAPLDGGSVAARGVAQSVARFVARTREPVVLDDTRADERFADDPRLAGGVRSALCLPLLHQGRLSGLLYLENNDNAGAFNEARVELLGLLSSQAAIAIENALLVAGVRAANQEVQRANERLEAEVSQRTKELRSTNQELGAANGQLQVELLQRELAERERAELQQRMIEAQRERLAEMSTPLIPITDEIMVMPLIGTVDAERAAQVLEVALDGAQRHRARVVIVDITGMKQIDAQVAGTLVNTAAALRLLGTEAVLTGIRPEVAQALVGLDIDLSTMVTHGTLQSGIAHALTRVGKASGRRSELSYVTRAGRPLPPPPPRSRRSR